MKLTHLFKAFSCDQCERSFGMEKDLIKHKRTHLDKPKENFDCEECHLTFKNKYRKKIHVLEIHEKKFDYPCSECDRKFCLKSQLNHHFGSAHKGRNHLRIWISAFTFKPQSTDLTTAVHLHVVYDQNHYFGFGPILILKPKSADTITDTETTF